MFIRKTAGIAMLGFAVWSVWKEMQRQGLARDGAMPAPAAVERWEGEGGALPVSGAQLGPDPVPSGKDKDVP